MFKENVMFYIDAQTKLNEGIVLLKNSSRLEKLARKINAKAMLVKDVKSKKMLNDFAQKIMTVAPEFRQLETEYRDAKTPDEKKVLKTKYRHLETKYVDLVHKVNNETFINALKATGISVLSLAALLTMVFILTPVTVTSSATVDETYRIPDWFNKILKPEDMTKLQNEVDKMYRHSATPSTTETKKFSDKF